MKISAFKKKGFTLVEVLVVITISTVLLAAVLNSYINYIKSTSKEFSQDRINAEVNSVFKILERDMMMAGYALPLTTKVAAHNNCSVGDETFCNTGSDRLFLANGWEILTDVTPNHEDDEQVPTSPTSYMTYLADTKNSAVGGYRAVLTSDVNINDASIAIADPNINRGQENTASPPYDDDFKNENALIVGDNSKVEGHRIDTAPSSPSSSPYNISISLLSNDTMSQIFLQAATPTPSVVPALVWYIRSDPDGKTYTDGTTVYWLYRNNQRVMKFVDNFQIQYGYDANNDGIQWADTLPPPSVRIRPAVQPSPDSDEDPWINDGWVPTPDSQTFELSQLKVIKIIITVKNEDKGVIKRTPYQKIIYLRN